MWPRRLPEVCVDRVALAIVERDDLAGLPVVTPEFVGGCRRQLHRSRAARERHHEQLLRQIQNAFRVDPEPVQSGFRVRPERVQRVDFEPVQSAPRTSSECGDEATQRTRFLRTGLS